MGTTDLLLQLKSYECIAQQILWMKLLVIIAFVYRLRIFTWQILKAWRSALANNQTTHIEKERVYIQAMYQNTALFKYHDFKVFLLQTWNETFPSTHEKSIKEV